MGLPFSSPGCRRCSDTEGFLNQGLRPILPGLPALYASTRPSQSAIGPWDWGFYTVRDEGRHQTRRTRFSSPGCRSCRNVEGRLNRGWVPILPGCPRYTRLRAPANQRSAREIGVSTPCGAVSTRENSIFVPGLSELQGYRRMSEMGTGPYPPRVALDLRALANRRSARGIEGSTPCGAVSTRENSTFVPGLSEL